MTKKLTRPTFGGNIRAEITSMVTRILKVHSCRMLWSVKRNGKEEALLYPSLSLILGVRSGPESGSQVRIQMFPPKNPGQGFQVHRDRVNAFIAATGHKQFLSEKGFEELLSAIDEGQVQDLFKGLEFQGTITPWFAPQRDDEGQLIYRDQHPELLLDSDQRWIPWKEHDPITNKAVETQVLAHWATDAQSIRLYTLIDAQGV